MTSVVVTQTTINASVTQQSTSVSVTSTPVNVTISPVDINSHSAVTLGTANGLSLVGQVLSLALSSAGSTGALSSADWSTFNGKLSDAPSDGTTYGRRNAAWIAVSSGVTDHAALSNLSYAASGHTGFQASLGYTPVDIASANYIDLTDGGATTLHSHAGGGSISGSGVVGQLAEWVTNSTTLQAAKLIAPTGAILTLVNANAKSITFPGSTNDTVAMLATTNIFTAKQSIKLSDNTLAHLTIGDVSALHTDYFAPNLVYGTPAYANAGGTGDRTSSITASTTLTLGQGVATTLVNGNTTEDVLYFNGQTASGKEIKFYFVTARIITEAKFYQSNSNTHGDWKWQGSNNGTDWTDIGSSFTLGGATTQTQTQLSGNTTAYIYYRLLGVSGSSSSGPWIREFEFKIANLTDNGPSVIQGYTAGATSNGAVSLNPLGGSVLIGGFALTVPENLTAAGRNVANTFTANQTIILDGATLSLINPTPEDALLGRETQILFYGTRANSTQFISGKIQSRHPSGNNDGRGDMVFSVSDDSGTLFERIQILQDGQIRFGSTAAMGATVSVYSGPNNHIGYFFMRDSSPYAFEITTTTTEPIFFRTNNSSVRMSVWDSGNVGIGNNNDAGSTTEPSARLHVVNTTTTTNAVLEVERIEARVSTGATGGSNGFGAGLTWYAETATDETNQQQGLISTSWIDATNASRKAKMSLSAYDTAARLGIEIEASGSAVKLGLYGAATVIQPAGANQAALTNSTTGTYNGTLVDVGVVFSQAAINDNFTDVYTLLTEIRTALVNTGIMKGAA